MPLEMIEQNLLKIHVEIATQEKENEDRAKAIMERNDLGIAEDMNF